MITDAHCHIWTNDLAHYPLAPGREPDPIDPNFDARRLLDMDRPLGISRVVLIQSSQYGTDNSYLVDMIAAFPGKFAGVAVIDMAGPVAQTMVALQRQGVRGFRIVAHKTRKDLDTWLNGTGYHEMFATAARSGQSPCCLIDPEAIPALDRMCRQYPHTSVVIDHLARIGVDGQVREQDVDLLCSLARHPNVRVKVSAFYALGQKKAPYRDLLPMIRRLYGALGSRRLMWATDGPYQAQNGHTFADSLALIQRHADFLHPDDRDWLLGKTAEQVFF